ncbi:FmdB family zinc ribbon protein [Paraburkholderia sediminicola]|uniref:FmdB family zinc ribbon protein n=2 Tax=Paraburkholderia sediminicola TaxID=458836 RepID=UPI0038BD6A8D
MDYYYIAGRRWPYLTSTTCGILVGGTMPTYKYRCEKCGEMFEHAEHLAEHEAAHPACPKCGSEKVQHIPTPFVAKTSRKS